MPFDLFPPDLRGCPKVPKLTYRARARDKVVIALSDPSPQKDQNEAKVQGVEV